MLFPVVNNSSVSGAGVCGAGVAGWLVLRRCWLATGAAGRSRAGVGAGAGAGAGVGAGAGAGAGVGAGAELQRLLLLHTLLSGLIFFVIRFRVLHYHYFYYQPTKHSREVQEFVYQSFEHLELK